MLLTATEFIERFPDHEDIKPCDTEIRENGDCDHVFLFPIFKYHAKFYAPPIAIDKRNNSDLSNMAVYWLFTRQKLETEPHRLDIVNYPVYRQIENAWPETITQILVPHAWKQVLNNY